MQSGVVSACDRLIVGCGYLGRRVAAHWLRSGEGVVALTRSADRARELRAMGIIPVIGDLTQADSLVGLPVSRTVLIAAGLDRGSGKSQRDVYVEGLKNLLAALPVAPRQMILISSTSVYGQDRGEWVDEVSETVPQAENGRICLEAEQLLRAQEPGAIIIRSAGIYGPGRMIARVETLRSGQPMSGNPRAWLNLIHVDDLAMAVAAVAKSANPGSLWLASDNSPCLRRDYYSLVAQLAGTAAPVFADLARDSSAHTGLNKRCSNRTLRERLHLIWRFPTIAEGVPHALGLDR